MGIRDRKERERKERIKLILESARKAIIKKGYSSTTIEEVAAEAEVSTATIYLYFKSKDDLFMALAVEGLEFIGKELAEIESKNNRTFIEDIDAVWNVFVRAHQKHREGFFIILISQQFGILNSISSEQREIINSLGRDIYNKIREIMEKHIRSGEIIDIESKAIPDLIWGMFAAAVQVSESKTVRSKKKILETNTGNYLEVLKRGLIKKCKKIGNKFE